MAQEIIVYSTPFCGPCDKLKQYLAKNGVQFIAKDLMMDEEAADHIDSLGIRSSPVLEVDGRAYAGAQLSPESLAGILGLKAI
ncbi:MAG: glutaredoxin family protein [Proteobacteria bacterium]|nr:glutaredoxin family protein [Pseudomonadota bacterium]